ncbi:hypothetical protein K1T71_010460 [Dendrolimus kikuchii]|uniref:Uncharacterized protein n=1 Tax=Dendrolimus kikuchii TaxID=765133 RepID=A0ACC1CRK8_9NEOP|nr:hypothetical protein K1T71_010460 [Dendrolimus kikuchii]
MGALDCVNKMSPTESTEVFTVPMASSTTLNEPKRDVESQAQIRGCVNRKNLWWTVGVDIPLLLIVLALIILFEVNIIPAHKFGFYCNDPAISFPYDGDTVTTEILISTLAFMPLLIMFPTEMIFANADYTLKERTFKSLRNTACLYRTYLFGLLMNLGIVEVMKGLIGTPRPTFFDLCAPDAAKTCTGSEFVSKYECTSTKYSSWYQMDSYRSFPSGHASMSVYCGLFLAWYLQRRAFDWTHRTVVLVPVLQLLCISYAAICSLTRITDHRHHWWDVLAGTGIGIVTFIYAAMLIRNKLKSRSSVQSIAVKSDASQHTIGTLLFDERR